MRPRALRLVSVACLAVAGLTTACAGRRVASPSPFRVEETTIGDIHAAFRAGSLTCRALVGQYLERIAAYDKQGPAINALVVVNPDALIVADALDARFARGGMTGPLHCIPVIVKDNMETLDLPTSAGSRSLAGFVSERDAFIVKRVREAGAVILAKSNMAEFAFSPYETVGSIIEGPTRNPYALDRVPAGSSGGTAASVASSLGEVGLGTDTGNSIRGPSAHNALVGIRPTMGLTSRAGIVPLNLGADVAGPMARTVADAAAVLDVIAGADPADPVTATSAGHIPRSYAASLNRDGLRGARIGILRQAYERQSTDSEVVALFERALGDMRRQGAIIVDSIAIDSTAMPRGNCNQTKSDLNQWLASHGDRVPVHTLEEIIASGRFHPSIEQRLRSAQAVALAPADNPGCRTRDESRARFRAAVLGAMDRMNLDALAYPTWSNPPRLIGDLTTPHGDNNQLFAPSTGFPAITLPMGYLRDDQLPAGVQLLGRPWSEARLIELGYSYEQATRHRRAPGSAPALGARVVK
jgi:Asp-tRNA(Asn)/Glu-tRNA(Gln) amidotransferase A subunit family amidase